MKIENTEGYGYFNGRPSVKRTRTLTVEIVLDDFEGAFYSPEDHMKWMCQLPYVKSVKLEG